MGSFMGKSGQPPTAPTGANLRLVASQKDGAKSKSKPKSGNESANAAGQAPKPKIRLNKSKLPRGITEVRWENATVRDSVRYRVRINRKGFKADQLFDDFLEAEEFLLMSKTKDGRLGLTEREARAQVIEDVVKDMLSRRPFSFYMNQYVSRYVDPKPEPNEVKKQSKKTVINRIKGLRAVRLTWKSVADRERTGLLAVIPSPGEKNRKQPLGDFFLDEIDTSLANEFLTVRSKDHAASTVERERGQLQTIWSKIRQIDQAAGKKLPYENPWQEADKGLLHYEAVIRDSDLSLEQEQRLLASLAKCRNKYVPLIVGFALSTGMRRGEILMLEWRQVKDGYLVLPPAHTKNSKPRNVMLTEDGKVMLAPLVKLRAKDSKETDRIFPLTTNAFKKSWNAARRRADVGSFRFHDTRRVAVTQMLSQMAYPSPVLISAMTGMQSVTRIEQEYVKPWDDRERARTGRVQSEADIRANVGHADARMTKLYANLGPKSVGKPVKSKAPNSDTPKDNRR
jgi:integrase